MKATRLRRAAGVLALVIAMIALPTPANAEVVQKGSQCEGVAVPRCGWLNYDTVSRNIRGYASARDLVGDGKDYTVDAGDIVLLYLTPTSSTWQYDWNTFVSDDDNDPTKDTASTGLRSCPSGWRFYVYATVWWTGYSNGSDAVSSSAFTCP